MSASKFLKYTATGRVAVIPYRFFGIAFPHLLRQLKLMVRWTFQSREHYNHTYHLTPLSRKYLDSFISVVSGHSLSAIEAYSHELESDLEFQEILRQRALASRARYNSDVEPRFGRRIGWYALVRATKPRVVVETGVDRGLGTAVVALALKRNAEEGFPGMVHATDIVPECGHLLTEPFKSHCRIWIGDSVETLRKFGERVDIFIHDSDHRPEYEWAEFQAIQSKLHSGSLVLSDNSQASEKLWEFSKVVRKAFLYFQDMPLDHWWPGDGLGAAFVPGVKSEFSEAGAKDGTT